MSPHNLVNPVGNEAGWWQKRVLCVWVRGIERDTERSFSSSAYNSVVYSRLGSLATVCHLRQLVMLICYLLMSLGDSFLSGLHICHCLLAAPWAPEWASLIHFLLDPSVTHKVTFDLFNLVQRSHFIIETQRHHGTFLRSHSKWVAQSDQSWGFIPLFIYFYRHMFYLSNKYFWGWIGIRHRRRRWHPTPVLLPGKSHGRRSLVGYSPWGRKESDTTERFHFHFSLSCIGKGNGNPLQCSCLENPRDRGAWWAAIYTTEAT